MIYSLYKFLIYLLFCPFLVYIYYVKNYKGKYKNNLKERFAIYDDNVYKILKNVKKLAWFHNVSIGETQAAAILIKKFKAKNPDYFILATSVTEAGRQVSEQILKNAADLIVYAPFDIPFIIKNAYNTFKPDIYIAIETEIWPSLFFEFNRKKVKIILANCKLSPESTKVYHKMKPFFKTIFDQTKAILIQAEFEKKELVKLGLNPEKIEVTGNLKFDTIADTKTLDKIEAENLKKEIGLLPETPVFIAGSTHKGEDAIVISAYRKIKEKINNCFLIIAPRKFDTVDEIITLLGNDLRYKKRSEFQKNIILKKENYDVLILDTIGELCYFYSISNVAFVGASFVPLGGHNILEPAIYGVPSLWGPSMYSFIETASLLKDRGGYEVQNENELAEKGLLLFKNEEKNRKLGINAKKIIMENRGAVEKTMNSINKIISRL